MVAIDDSLSMKENGSGRLALEALTVICRALTQIEVGELAVVSFGDAVQLVHPFDKQFSDESGAYAVSQFQFSQAHTSWPAFLEKTIRVLDEAKMQSNHSASQDHLQLVFIISDGIVQQEREHVARLTREAQNKGQLLVLLIVDSPSPNSSVLTKQSPVYENGKLKLKGYLDDYPFPFYIVLRDINALPEIVADALRQWFELIQKST